MRILFSKYRNSSKRSRFHGGPNVNAVAIRQFKVCTSLIGLTNYLGYKSSKNGTNDSKF